MKTSRDYVIRTKNMINCNINIKIEYLKIFFSNGIIYHFSWGCVYLSIVITTLFDRFLYKMSITIFFLSLPEFQVITYMNLIKYHYFVIYRYMYLLTQFTGNFQLPFIEIYCNITYSHIDITNLEVSISFLYTQF